MQADWYLRCEPRQGPDDQLCKAGRFDELHQGVTYPREDPGYLRKHIGQAAISVFTSDVPAQVRPVCHRHRLESVQVYRRQGDALLRLSRRPSRAGAEPIPVAGRIREQVRTEYDASEDVGGISLLFSVKIS